MDNQAEKPEIKIIRRGDDALMKLSGTWKAGCPIPAFSALIDQLKPAWIQRLAFDCDELQSWDSALIVFLRDAHRFCADNGLTFLPDGLPDSAANLLELATAVPEKKDARRSARKRSWIHAFGLSVISGWKGLVEVAEFTGHIVLGFGRILTGQRRVRWKDFFVIMEEVGANALPITTLLSFLTGLIIAFLGAVVLRQFAAEYYVSYLVGYGMLREMGALMTGIIMAGRTGAAFAAEIGTMKVTEELDALETLGIRPVDFIVIPRMVALCLMVPLLTIYADIIGIFSGSFVAAIMLQLGPNQFFLGMNEAVGISDFILGVTKGAVFGVLVAISGCLRGMQCGNSADAVGLAATAAVVTGITLIVFANAIIDWIAAIYNV